MPVFWLGAFILSQLLSYLAFCCQLLSEFLQAWMSLKVGVCSLKNILVMLIEIKKSFEHLVSLDVVFLDFSTVKDNFFNKELSEIFEDLKLLFLPNDLSSLPQIIKPGLNSMVENFLDSLIQKLLQLSVTQLINMVEPLLSELSQHFGVV